jgi:hypothetical protein
MVGIQLRSLGFAATCERLGPCDACTYDRLDPDVLIYINERVPGSAIRLRMAAPGHVMVD